MARTGSDPGSRPPGPGPLAGIRFVELGGIGPVPHAGMMLADLGATGVRVDRPGGQPLGHAPGRDPLLRGRPTRAVDLRSDEGRAEVLDLVAGADLLIEGFRPGVAERLGLGRGLLGGEPPPGLRPDDRLGPDRPGLGAGHDINYSAVAGPLRHTARPGGPGDGAEPRRRPRRWVDLPGDGRPGRLVEVARTGRGVVVDAAMVDGAANLMSLVHGMRAQGLWPNPPGRTRSTVARPFYDTYACADGRFVAVGALEPAFYAELLVGLGLDPADLPEQWDPRGWPRPARAPGAGDRRADPRRVGDGLRRYQRLRDPGTGHDRGARPPAARGPGDVRGRTRSPAPGCLVPRPGSGPATRPTPWLPGRDHGPYPRLRDRRQDGEWPSGPAAVVGTVPGRGGM